MQLGYDLSKRARKYAQWIFERIRGAHYPIVESQHINKDTWRSTGTRRFAK